MSYIALQDGTFAEEATPDPRRVFTVEELQQELTRKQQEVTMYENEIVNLGERKTALEAEITEIETLLNN